VIQGEFFDSTAPVSAPVDETGERHRRSLQEYVIPKLYRSISEVSAMTGIEQYVLRYWETEFDELKPLKNRAGNRIYSEKEIKVVNRIKELLRDQHYTIEGARNVFKQEREMERHPVEAKPVKDKNQLAIIPPPVPKEVVAIVDELKVVRAKLVEARKMLE
jgi:DNA-binding transcriptional MerR regulator